MELNKYSKTITLDPTQPAAQAMFYGIGLTDADLNKAQVGIASMGYDGNTCNMHLNALAADVKKSVWENDLVGLTFHTIGVSDGMSNGTDGMRYSLVSRDVNNAYHRYHYSFRHLLQLYEKLILLNLSLIHI